MCTIKLGLSNFLARTSVKRKCKWLPIKGSDWRASQVVYTPLITQPFLRRKRLLLDLN